MTVLVLEENLLWSSRLKSGVEALGHACTVVARPSAALPDADCAIVNLGSRTFPPDEWIPRLRALGLKVVAHAGHKEKPLLQVGTDSGADLVVSNGTITHKLGDVLDRLVAQA